MKDEIGDKWAILFSMCGNPYIKLSESKNDARLWSEHLRKTDYTVHRVCPASDLLRSCESCQDIRTLHEAVNAVKAEYSAKLATLRTVAAEIRERADSLRRRHLALAEAGKPNDSLRVIYAAAELEAVAAKMEEVVE